MENKNKQQISQSNAAGNIEKLDETVVLQTIIDNMPFDTWFKDKEGRYLAVNKNFVAYTGRESNDIIGKNDFELYPEEEAKIYAASDRATIAGTGRKHFEALVNERWKEEYKKAVYDTDGMLIGTTGFTRDITERKSIEEALQESERSKAVLISNLPGVAYRCKNDKDWTMTFLSNGCFELTGYLPEELLNNKLISYNQLISPEFRKKMYSIWESDIANEQKSSDEYTIITKSGEVKWVWEQSVCVPDKDGNLTESEGFILDITDIKNAVAALNASEDRFKTIFQEAPLGIGIFNTDSGRPIQLNPKFGEILGRSIEELMVLDWRAYSYPDELQENINYLNQLKKHEIESFHMNKRYFKPDGSTIWVSMIIVPFQDETIKGMHLCMIQDISESKKREEEIIYLSYHDILTGLYNRTFFEEQKKQLDSSRKLPQSLIMGDVNGLKLINDSFGHNQGDMLLKEIAGILKKSCRGEDIIARIGGDEFVIILGQTDEKGAETVCRRIYKACKDYEKSDERQTFYLSISLGYATKTRSDQDIDALLREAEHMLYKRKNPDRKKVRKTIIQSIKNELNTRKFGSKVYADNLFKLAGAIGESLNLSANKLKELQLLMELHDIGQLALSDDLSFNNNRIYTKEEQDEYEKHTEIGYRIAMAMPEASTIAEEILYHHEHWDGSGYSKGRAGDEIPLLSRIVCVLDAYDEWMKKTKHDSGRKLPMAGDFILAAAGKKFDPKVAQIFATIMDEDQGL